MKMILLLVGMIAFGALSVSAQEGNRVLFPDLQKDKQALAEREAKALETPPAETVRKPFKERTFTNYNKSNVKAAKTAALQPKPAAEASKLSSQTEAGKVTKPEIKKPDVLPIFQEGQEPKALPNNSPKKPAIKQ
jgi:hypothetical protein